jgi:hypothetical protein
MRADIGLFFPCSPKALRDLYRKSEPLCFGMVSLEAMACALPAIATEGTRKVLPLTILESTLNLAKILLNA